jgi:hypothetical protein
MQWRADVAARLRTLLGVGSGAPVAVLAARARDRRTLRTFLPGVVGFRLATLGFASDGVAGDVRAGRCAGDGNARRPDALALRSGDRGRRAGAGAIPVADAALEAAVVWLVATRMPNAGRRLMLAELHRTLRIGGTLVVVDHNRPRSRWGRLRNFLWCILHGVGPSSRPAYPVAQEVQAAGFAAVSLRLAYGERIQIVRAARPPDDSVGGG